MLIETILGQPVAKANNYMVAGKGESQRIIKNQKMRDYEASFLRQCKLYKNKRISSRFRLFIKVYHSSVMFDLDNTLKSVLDLLEQAGAIVNDRLCVEIQAFKFVDKYHPRIEFALEELDKQTSIF